MNSDTPVPEPTNAELEDALGVSRRTVQRLRHRPGCPRAGDHATFEEYVAALRAFAGRVTPSVECDTGGDAPVPATPLPETPPLESLAKEPDADHLAADTGDVGAARESCASAAEPSTASRPTPPAAPLEPVAHPEAQSDAKDALLEAPGEPGGADSLMSYDDAAVQELADTLVIVLRMALALSRIAPGERADPDRHEWVESGIKATLGALKGVLPVPEFQQTKLAVWARANECGYRDTWCPRRSDEGSA